MGKNKKITGWITYNERESLTDRRRGKVYWPAEPITETLRQTGRCIDSHSGESIDTGIKIAPTGQTSAAVSEDNLSGSGQS
eukprot:UN02294